MSLTSIAVRRSDPTVWSPIRKINEEPAPAARSAPERACGTGVDSCAVIRGCGVFPRPYWPSMRQPHSGWSTNGLRLPCQAKITSLRRRSASSTRSSSCQTSSVHRCPRCRSPIDVVRSTRSRSGCCRRRCHHSAGPCRAAPSAASLWREDQDRGVPHRTDRQYTRCAPVRPRRSRDSRDRGSPICRRGAQMMGVDEGMLGFARKAV